MKHEIEAKFLDVHHDEIRRRLQEAGATCVQPMRLMRRVVIETPELLTNSAFLRVRDEGNRVTITYKQIDSLKIDGVKEIETTVGDFDAVIEILSRAGLPFNSLQESKRETWHIDGAEVLLDEWPWLQPYVEIEADDESSVQTTAARLGFSWNQAVFGDVMTAYRHEYPHLTESDTIARLPEVKFNTQLPDMLIP